MQGAAHQILARKNGYNCSGLPDFRRREPSVLVRSKRTNHKKEHAVSFVRFQKQTHFLDSQCGSSMFPTYEAPSFPDRWIQESVCDIVRNIKEAPFMHLLFEDSSVRSHRRIVPKWNLDTSQQSWNVIKDCVNDASPDCVISVRHLDDEAEGVGWMSNFCDKLVRSRDENREGGATGGTSTDIWGVLVQGRSIAQSACYILKTTSVVCAFGTCTHFCLTRVKCFGPSWCDQVQESWLLEKGCHGDCQ